MEYFVSELFIRLSNIEKHKKIEKEHIVRTIAEHILSSPYTMVEKDDQRPWGAFFKLDNGDADTFIEEFFDGLSPTDARLGHDGADLSPKILLVSPKKRLSWQYHERRAERWRFVHNGLYIRSDTDEEQELQIADIGHEVQFSAGERHRLIGHDDDYTVVAEIWQHTDQEKPSSEEDIVRLSDDFGRGNGTDINTPK